MSLIFALVEGQTELEFVSSVLRPHLAGMNLNIQGVLVKTKREASGRAHRGGLPSYASFKRQIKSLLGDSHAVLVTTMFDYYGLGTDYKSQAQLSSGASSSQKVHAIETAIEQDIGDGRFKAYLALHEFEAMLFVDPGITAYVAQHPHCSDELAGVAAAFTTPEDINDSPTTAPSKRLISCIPSYDKTFHGPLATIDIGLQRIRNACPHFAEWLACLEQHAQ